MGPSSVKGSKGTSFEKAIETLTVLGCDARGNPPGGLRLLKEEVNIVTPDGKKVVLVWPGKSWDTQVRGDIATSTTDEPKCQYITEVITGGGDNTGDPHLWGTLDPYPEPPPPSEDDDDDPEWPTLVWRPLDVPKLRKALGNQMSQQTRLAKAHQTINEEREKIRASLIKKNKMEEAADYDPLPYTPKYARWQRDVTDPDTEKSTFVEVAVLSDNVWQARESAPKRDRSKTSKKDEESTSCTFMNAKAQGELFDEMEGLDNGDAPVKQKNKKRIVVESSDSEEEAGPSPAPVPPKKPAPKQPAAAKGPAPNKKRSAASMDDSDVTLNDIQTFVGFYDTIKRRREETGNNPIKPFIDGGWPAEFGPEAWNKIGKGPDGKERVRLMMASLQMCAIGDTMKQVHASPHVCQQPHAHF